MHLLAKEVALELNRAANLASIVEWFGEAEAIGVAGDASTVEAAAAARKEWRQ